MALLLAAMSVVVSCAQLSETHGVDHLAPGIATKHPQQSFSVLSTALAREELGLNDKQIEKVKKLDDAYEAALQRWFRRVSRLPPEEQEKHPTTEFSESFSTKLHGILTPEQRLRLREMLYQRWGMSVFAPFSDPEAVRCLDLSRDQVTNISEMVKQHQEERWNVVVEHGLNNPEQYSAERTVRELDAIVAQRRLEKEAIAKVLKLMTPLQIDTWKQLRGRPIDLVELDNQIYGPKSHPVPEPTLLEPQIHAPVLPNN